MGENITIRTAEISGFDSVYGLLEQPWPDEMPDRVKMLLVYEKAITMVD